MSNELYCYATSRHLESFAFSMFGSRGYIPKQCYVTNYIATQRAGISKASLSRCSAVAATFQSNVMQRTAFLSNEPTSRKLRFLDVRQSPNIIPKTMVYSCKHDKPLFLGWCSARCLCRLYTKTREMKRGSLKGRFLCINY